MKNEGQMLTILTKIWAFLSSKAAEYLGIGAALLGVFAFIRRTGENAVIMTQQKETLKDVAIRNQIDASVDNLSDAAVNNELSKWKK